MKQLFLFLLVVLTLPVFSQNVTTVVIPLNGSVTSKAADATSITPKWTVQSGNATIANPNSLTTTATVTVGVTIFALTGTDNFGVTSAPALKRVTVVRNNIPPVMNAGKDTTIQLGSSAFIPNKLITNYLVSTENKQGQFFIKIEDIK